MTEFVQMTFDDLIHQKEEKYVRRISYDETKPFLLTIHYARRMPCITDAFGLFEDGRLIGVVTYGIPASYNLCVGICGKEYKDDVRELNRLVLLPEYNGKNYASFLVGRSLKMLDNGIIVVSYADTGWGHCGYIYQVTNFIYTGLSAQRNDVYQPNGLHPRAYDKENHSEYLQTRNPKHRYIYFCGDKRTRKKLLKLLKYPIKPYPKGDDVKYDINNPTPVIPIKIIKREKTSVKRGE